MAPGYDPGSLRLDGEPGVAQQEVDLYAAGEPPVGEVVVQVQVADEGGELVEDPVLQRLTVQL